MAEQITRATHETFVGDNPPTTEQLFRLTSHAIIAARAKKKLQPVQPRVYYSIKDSTHYNEPPDTIETDYPSEIYRRMAIRIGRRTLDSMPMKEWSLKLYDTTWYKPNGVWTGVRGYYRFEWMRQTVTLAERHLYFVPTPPPVDLYDHLEHLSIANDAVEMLHVTQEMSEVTAGDCEQLITEVADYYGNNPQSDPWND